MQATFTTKDYTVKLNQVQDSKRFSVKLRLKSDLSVIIASGRPSISQDPGSYSINFEADDYFVLHVFKNGEQFAIVTPGI